MEKLKITKQSLLSTLWIFVLLNMIFRDLHELAKKSYIEKILSSEIAEELLLVFGFVLEIPILMVVLSKILNDKTNKWANLVAALIVFFGLLSTAPSADLDDIFFMIMKCAALLVITITAWKLPLSTKKVEQP
ncbi:MAG: DUF6326 family protein [Maribacter sp.]|uniref:DUF6326 family protein n=1 Tax=Maribacter sp. TaxID=1897614 RepID=UPI00329698FC